MIKLLRVDERLIHGQVAVTWCTTLGIDRIVVANDEATSNEVQKVALKMSAPHGIKVAIKGVEDAITLLNDARLERFSVLVLVKNPADAIRVVEAVPRAPYVNVGNYGLIDSDVDRKMLTVSVAVTPEERAQLHRIVELRPKSTYQMTVANPPEPLANIA